MDVVKTNIEQMSGDIHVESTLGQGSTFKVTLPQTFSIVDSTIVMAGKDRYVVPIMDVLESVSVGPDMISESSNLGPVMSLRGEKFPLFYLDELLERPQETRNQTQIAMIMHSQRETFAVVVDEIMGRHPLVIKNLGSDLADYKQFSGSTILADGKPALIIELSQLVRRTAQKRTSENLRRLRA